jgi:hypothetical protein
MEFFLTRSREGREEMQGARASRKIAINLLVGFVCFLFAAQLLFASDWTLTDANFHSSRISIDSIQPDGIHLTPTTQPALIPWDNCLELTRSGDATGASPVRFTLYTRSNDHLTGDPVAIEGDTLHWQNTALGNIDFPIGSVAAVAKSDWPVSGLDDARADDVLSLSNNDTTHGVVTQIDPTGVGLQSGDTTTTVPWDAITAVLLSTQGASAAPKGQAFRVTLAGDQSLTVPRLDLTGDTLTLYPDGKSPRPIPLESVTAIEQLNGPVIWLSSQKPTESAYHPFFSENYPPRFDRTVADAKPIPEKFPGFHHGIGCHSYTKLTFAIPPGVTGFRTQYAIDSDSPLADVTVRIYVDNKPVHEQKNVKSGPPAPVVTLPLDNAKSLSLEVDYGENYATEDRFAWLDPAFLRKGSIATNENADEHR